MREVNFTEKHNKVDCYLIIFETGHIIRTKSFESFDQIRRWGDPVLVKNDISAQDTILYIVDRILYSRQIKTLPLHENKDSPFFGKLNMHGGDVIDFVWIDNLSAEEQLKYRGPRKNRYPYD